MFFESLRDPNTPTGFKALSLTHPNLGSIPVFISKDQSKNERLRRIFTKKLLAITSAAHPNLAFKALPRDGAIFVSFQRLCVLSIVDGAPVVDWDPAIYRANSIDPAPLSSALRSASASVSELSGIRTYERI